MTMIAHLKLTKSTDKVHQHW